MTRRGLSCEGGEPGWLVVDGFTDMVGFGIQICNRGFAGFSAERVEEIGFFAHVYCIRAVVYWNAGGGCRQISRSTGCKTARHANGDRSWCCRCATLDRRLFQFRHRVARVFAQKSLAGLSRFEKVVDDDIWHGGIPFQWTFGIWSCSKVSLCGYST